MLRASIILFVFTAICQALIYYFTEWFTQLSVLVSIVVAFIFVVVTNSIWRIEWKHLFEVFGKETDDHQNY